MISKFPRAERGLGSGIITTTSGDSSWEGLDNTLGIFGSTKVCFIDLLSCVPANSHPLGKAQASVPASHRDL